MENIIEFPIGTKKAAKIIGCAERTVKRHCKILKIKRLNGDSGPYTIYEDDIEDLKNCIREKSGRPPVYK